MDRDQIVPLVIGAVILIALPLAGCVGGSGQSGPSADTTDDAATDDATDGTSEGTTSDDLQAHVHDRWDGRDVVSLVDRGIEIDPVSQEHPQLVQQCRRPPVQSGPMLCFGTATFFPETNDDGTGEVVPPGTKKVEVSLEFDSGFDRIRFMYQDRMSQGQWKSLGTFESGDTMTIQPIPVERSDDGHAKVSAWKFMIEPMGNPYPAGDDQVWYGEGTVDVTIEAFRQEGELPKEPAHPDFWVETSTYQIGRIAGEASGFTQAARVHTEEGECGPGIGETCAPVQLNSDGLIWTVGPGYEGERLGTAEPPQELSGEHVRALVPPESGLIAAEVIVEGDVQAPVEVCFRAMTSPDQGPYGDVVTCKEYAGGEETWTFERPITDREVDSFYTDNTGQNASRWTFVLQVRAPKQAADVSGVGSFDGSVEMSVFVTEDAEFTYPEWAGGSS